MLDIAITQGRFWNGSQLSYWIYLILVIFPFTGLLGIDHLALRSPITAFLKTLSIIPLFGFWYFYDISQVCGERDLIEKYGIGVPFYGPIGLGAGIFTKDGVKESPKNVPRPWLFIAYTIISVLLFFIPLNKFLIGDTAGGIFYLYFFLTGIGIFQGLYDIFNLVFDTKTLFEKGNARVPGASYFLGKYHYSASLGNTPGNVVNNKSSPAGNILSNITSTVTSAVGNVTSTVGNITSTVGNVKSSVENIIPTVKSAIPPAVDAAKEAGTKVAGVVKTVGLGVLGTVKSVGTGVAKGAAGVLAEEAHVPEITSLENAGDAAGRLVGTKAAEALAAQVRLASEGSRAAAGAASALGAVTRSIKDHPEAFITGSISPTVQKGGGLDLLIPSIPILLFTVSLVAFSGYVFYIYKNTHRKPEKTDDPPREPRAVRVPSERRQ